MDVPLDVLSDHDSGEAPSMERQKAVATHHQTRAKGDPITGNPPNSRHKRLHACINFDIFSCMHLFEVCCWPGVVFNNLIL